MLTELKRCEDFAFLKVVDSIALQQSLRDLDKGFVNFFQKHGDVFALYRLPGAYGCLIFNKLYPLDTEVSLPTHTEIERIIGEMRICADNTHMITSY